MEGGAVDAAMFASMTLASTYLKLNSLEEAQIAATFALLVAARIESPRGKAQAGIILGEIYELLGNYLESIQAYQMAAASASLIHLNQTAETAEASIARLKPN